MKLRRSTGSARLLLIAAVALSGQAIPQAIPAATQAASTGRPEDPTAAKLELQADPTIEKGKGAVVKGTVDPEGLRYSVGGLSILQPVVVTLLARDEADEVTLSLFKAGWESSLRTGSTRGSGVAQFEFRTEGGVNILVRGSSAASPFALIVWAGDELRPRMNDVVVSPAKSRKGESAATAADRAAAGSDATRGASEGDPGISWILLGAVIGGAVVFLLLRALGRRKQS